MSKRTHQPPRPAGSKKVPTVIDQTVGARIRLRRNEVGMSQEKLAAHLGLTYQQVQKYEKGVNRVGASRMVAIAKALGCSTSYFYEDVSGIPTPGTTTHGEAIQRVLQDKQGLRMVLAFDRLDPRHRDAIIDIVDRLAA